MSPLASWGENTMCEFDKARQLLDEFKGGTYLYGPGVLPQVGAAVARRGKRACLVRSTFAGSDDHVRIISESLSKAGTDLVAVIKGPLPNAPCDDVMRIAEELELSDPDVIVTFGGGSNIDATKAADVLRTAGRDYRAYFGTGEVSKALERSGQSLAPHVAIQAAASSAAHLTKYANITDLSTGQKKLIVDEAIIPECPVFDYAATYDAPVSLTADGALDGVSHSLEVLYGAVGKSHYGKAEEIAKTGISLIVKHLSDVIEYPKDVRAREALCLGTDMGGYAIMVGGTNGGHLTSFSLVDVLSHGRACALMNPYYTVFFAPAIERPLRVVGKIYKEAGYTDAYVEGLNGRKLGLVVAEAMLELAREIGFPTSLGDVEGFTDKHIERALTAAKDPQLKMKLQNMPIPLSLDMVDEYMRSVLEAAAEGNLTLVKNV